VSEKQVFRPFGDPPLPLFGSKQAEKGFRPQDFIKSKRGAAADEKNSFTFFDYGKGGPLGDGASKGHAPNAPLRIPTRGQRQLPRKANQQADEAFEDEGFEAPETDDDPSFVNDEESTEELRAKAAAAPSKHRLKENRYPKYSSYYHAAPKSQAQLAKTVEDDVDDIEKDDIENPFASAEEDDIGGKVDDSVEEEDLDAPLRQQQTKIYPAKYSAAYTAPKNARPVASNLNKQKAAYNDDPFFDDPLGFPAIQTPVKKGALHREPKTGYVDRTIRPASIKYGNFDHAVEKPFRPSPPDPLYPKAIAGIPSYDFDHSPSAEYRDVSGKPKRKEFAKSASLTAPSLDGRRSASNLKGHCKKVEKQIEQDPDGRFRRDAMTCFVCDDPKSGGTYEQCAYGSEPKTQAYYVGRSQQFRSADKEKPFTYRQRRFLKYSPYPSLPAAAGPALSSAAPRRGAQRGAQQAALKRQTRQEHDGGFADGGFEYDVEGATDDTDDYRFGPEHFTHDGESDAGDGDSDGESAPLKVAESAKSDTPENCKKVRRDNMICLVCKESKTGGNYEQCSYGSDPKKSSYSYGKSKSYGTPKKSYTERHRRYIAKGNGASKQPTEKFGAQKEKVVPATEIPPPKRKRNDEADDDVEDDLPKEIAEKSEPITGEVEVSENVPRKEDLEFDFDEFEKQSENDGKAEATEQQKGPTDANTQQPKYDDYFSFLFPEYSKVREDVKKAAATEDPFDPDDDDHYPAESKDLTTDFLVPDFFSAAEPNKKDLEKMLGEFTQKDRSECKKVMKDQMTCFQCVDAKGMQHEECMFVAASEPKTSHLAYHESKEFKMIDPKKTEATKLPGNDSTASPSLEAAKTTTLKPVNRNRGSKKHDSGISTTTTTAPSTTPKTDHKGRKRDTKANAALTRRTRGAVEKKRQGEPQKGEQSEEPELEVEEEVPETEEVEAGSASVAATAAEKLSDGETPPEFKPPEGPEGLYSEDTKPVYDKNLKLSLPKYMLSKSEHEAIFDEVLASGV